MSTAESTKVTDDMEMRGTSDRTGVVNAAEKEKEMENVASSRAASSKLELQKDSKWVVENQVGEKNLVIEDCDSKQCVYVYNCKYSVLELKGEVNKIILNKCTRTGLVFTDVALGCEILDCSSVEVHCRGTVPQILVENTSGCELYQNEACRGAAIVTARSTQTNVLVPGSTADADLVVLPVPEQFVHVYQDDGRFKIFPL